VCLLTAAELADGYGYDGTVPFEVDGEDVFPPRRGTYFEVPKSGKAIRAWAHSTGATQQLRRQLRLTNKRAGREVMAPDKIKKVTSKVIRRRMATLITRTLGIDAAVAMGEWSSRKMAKLYIDELDIFGSGGWTEQETIFALSSKLETDAEARKAAAVAATIAEVDVAETEAEAEAGPSAMEIETVTTIPVPVPVPVPVVPVVPVPMPSAAVLVAMPVPVSVVAPSVVAAPPGAAGVAGMSFVPGTQEEASIAESAVAHFSELLRRCQAGERATAQSRREYGTAQISVAVANNRANQNTVCCEFKGPNPLVKRELAKHPHVGDLIDSMAAKSVVEIQKVLCTHGLHTSLQQINTFRHGRFQAAGGRQAFIAARA